MKLNNYALFAREEQMKSSKTFKENIEDQFTVTKDEIKMIWHKSEATNEKIYFEALDLFGRPIFGRLDKAVIRGD